MGKNFQLVDEGGSICSICVQLWHFLFYLYCSKRKILARANAAVIRVNYDTFTLQLQYRHKNIDQFETGVFAPKTYRTISDHDLTTLSLS